MAVSFQTVSSVARATATTNLTITKPTGLAVGDLMIAHTVRYDNDTTARNWDTLSGWTSIQSASGNDGATGYAHKAQFKVATSGDVAASNFTFTVDATTDILAGAIYRISGQSGVATLINASVNEFVNNDETPSFASSAITPSIADCLLLFLAFSVNGGSSSKTHSSQAITTSNPTWTEDYDDHNSTVLTISGAHASRPETTSTGAASFSSTGDATTDCGLILIAITPAYGVTVSPSTITSTGTVQTPTVTGGATFSATTITSTGTVNTPSHMGQADWSATAKSQSGTWTAQTKS